MGQAISGLMSNELHSQQSEARGDVDIVIVGAGPTGLFSALLARQLGLNVVIVDAKNEPISIGGADAITARTQQYLEVFDNFRRMYSQDTSILSDLSEKGIKCNTSTTYADGEITSRQSHWWNSLPHTFYSHFVMIGQPYIEQLFESALDVTVGYSEPVVDLSPTSSYSGVTVKTDKREIRARYCIAADGAKSFIRNKLGIQREGTKPNMVWTVLDCWIETSYPVAKEIVALQLNGESRMAWIPRERGMQRFYLLLDGESTLENALASMKAHMAPHTVEITHVEWLSKFESKDGPYETCMKQILIRGVKERVADAFVYPSPEDGPFILVGDAAHVHAVNGGQGMNTGLADAFNLIWRLNYLIKFPDLSHESRASLLASFDRERRATAKEVISVASKLVRATKTAAKDYVKLIELNSGFITGMGVIYSGMDSPLVVESAHGIFKAGNRLPDLWLEGSNVRHATRLYQQLIYGKYLLLLVGQQDRGIEVKNDRFINIIQLHPLSKLITGRENGKTNGSTGTDFQTVFRCSAVEDDSKFVVLARPDCYIEHVGSVEEVVNRIQSHLPGLIA